MCYNVSVFFSFELGMILKLLAAGYPWIYVEMETVRIGDVDPHAIPSFDLFPASIARIHGKIVRTGQYRCWIGALTDKNR